jgi:hypothetical protein
VKNILTVKKIAVDTELYSQALSSENNILIELDGSPLRSEMSKARVTTAERGNP